MPSSPSAASAVAWCPWPPATAPPDAAQARTDHPHGPRARAPWPDGPVPHPHGHGRARPRPRRPRRRHGAGQRRAQLLPRPGRPHARSTFEYMQQMAAGDRAGRRRGRPLDVVHLGAAGCALARAVHAARPGLPPAGGRARHDAAGAGPRAGSTCRAPPRCGSAPATRARSSRRWPTRRRTSSSGTCSPATPRRPTSATREMVARRRPRAAPRRRLPGQLRRPAPAGRGAGRGRDAARRRSPTSPSSPSPGCCAGAATATSCSPRPTTRTCSASPRLARAVRSLPAPARLLHGDEAAAFVGKRAGPRTRPASRHDEGPHPRRVRPCRRGRRESIRAGGRSRPAGPWRPA